MESHILIYTAVSIGFIHTIIGPDHYLPFIMIGRARNWTWARTATITFLCGVGHVLGSVLLGLAGILLGIAVGTLEGVEAVRGNIAGWLFIGFGLAYGVWGLRIGWRSREHSHPHSHEGLSHTHHHHHLGSHAHLHGDPKSVTPWMLFIIFVLGPCEPLIPILMYPAAQHHWWSLLRVTLAFGITTISTMLVMVWVFHRGLTKIRFRFMERYMHAIAGFIIAVSGLSIQFLGL